MSNDPTLSADGRYVAYGSVASTLVAGDTNGARDIFVHDRTTATTTRVSVATGGTQSNGTSEDPVLSDDGRYVVFQAAASNLVAGDTNAVQDAFVHDRQTGTTSRLSVSSSGVEGNGDSLEPTIAGNGSAVAFESAATNLVTGDTNAAVDIFVRDLAAGTTVRVSVDSAGAQANGASDESSFSGDGSHVAFESLASNLVAGDTNAPIGSARSGPSPTPAARRSPLSFATET